MEVENRRRARERDRENNKKVILRRNTMNCNTRNRRPARKVNHDVGYILDEFYGHYLDMIADLDSAGVDVDDRDIRSAIEDIDDDISRLTNEIYDSRY